MSGSTERTAVNYDAYVRANRGRRLRILATIEERYQGRVARGRPRDPEEERLLLQLDISRRDRLLASGELVQIGPRAWRWRL